MSMQKISKYELIMMYGNEAISRLLRGVRVDGLTINKNSLPLKDELVMIATYNSLKRGDISGNNNPRADKKSTLFLIFIQKLFFLAQEQIWQLDII